MRFYRAVSDAERLDVLQCGVLRPPSNQGKWLAEQLDDAVTWGNYFYRPPTPFTIFEVEIDDMFAATLYCDPNKDRIGPARFSRSRI